MVQSIDALIDKGNQTTGRRTHADASELLESFASELCLPDNKVPAEAIDLSTTFVLEVIMPIAWYARRITKAERIRDLFIVLSLCLIVVIPLLLAWLPKFADLGANPSTAIVAQLTGALTGVLALQKMIAATLAQQQRYGAWWKASSDLKKVWYEFQSQWVAAQLATSWPDQSAAFLIDAARRIDKARTIVSDEQADFFAKLTLPSLDVLDVLKTTRTNVGTLVTDLVPAATASDKHAADVLKAKQDIAKYTSLLATLDGEIARARTDLAAPPPGQTAAQISEVLKDLLKKRTDYNIAKMDAEAALAVLAIA
ncbi:hypothetical protein [Reyranella sp.]|uniref:hypothetical protein n=1 Tax=Reyranella sp. TaxID=1929291 RepID=UPI003D10F757